MTHYQGPSTGEWIRVLHATLRRKARCEANGEDPRPITTADLLGEEPTAGDRERDLPLIRAQGMCRSRCSSRTEPARRPQRDAERVRGVEAPPTSVSLA